MRRLGERSKRLSLLAVAVLLIASCGLLAAQSWPDRPAARRLDAQRRWAERPFANYRVAVRVEYWGNVCSQDIESAGEKLHRIVRNDCRVPWLALMTVARLFEISEGLEHPTPCYVAAQTCSCYRVRAGEIAYDPHLGYPRTITYRRQIYPNLLHPDYWRRVWQTRQLPECGPISPIVRITVTSLRPRVLLAIENTQGIVLRN
jgi:hypothetical protein